MPDEGQLPELFRSENAICTVSSNNTFENFGRRQQGGTFGLAFGQLASRVQDVGGDDLGRWSWMLFRGRDGHKVRIVVAYQPCRAKDTQVGMVYQQHKRQLMQAGLATTTNPRVKFREDLVLHLRTWRQANERLILFIDANENTVKGPLNNALTGPGLLMQEAVRSLHPLLPDTPTFKAGSRTGQFPIDAAYVTPNLPVSAGLWVSVKQSPGDHHSCILEIWWKSLVSEDLFKIARPNACRLSSEAYYSVTNYGKLLH